MEAGASGVINKSRGLAEIISAVRRLAGGEEILTPDEVLRMCRIAREVRARDAEARLLAASLTPREREVLKALTEGLGRKEIARKLSISLSTEHTHVNRILGKLGVHSRLEAVLLAARHDLTGVGPTSEDTRRTPPYPTSGARTD